MRLFPLVWQLALALAWAWLPLTCPATVPGSARPGSLDLSFDAKLSEFSQVYVVKAQPDGRLLMGGAFDSVAGVPRANIARLNADGTLDPSFNPGTAVDQGFVAAIALDQNGKVLVGGAFSSSDHSAPKFLARLNSDGSVDYGFDPSLYLDGPVNAVAVQDEDYIVIAGAFVYVNGYRRQNVARLHQNGALDYSFDACVASTAGLGASALALLPDGHILVTGKFTFTGNRYRNGIARLESCGDLDANYAAQPGINTDAEVYTLALLANGNVLLGGSFLLYNGQPRAGLAELDANGNLLSSVEPATGVDGGTIYAMAVQADQKPLIGGNFSLLNDSPASSIARLDWPDTVDGTFDPGTGPDNAVSSILLLSDGRLLLAGKFSSYDGVQRQGLVRLHGDFAPGRLGRPARLADGQWQLFLQGEEGRQYSIEASSNLLDWSAITNFTASAGGVTLIDSSDQGRPLRFYRAVSAP